jgi:hypothetical protein
MRKDYTISEIYDVIPKDELRRTVKVIVKVDLIKEKPLDPASTTFEIELGYPAYGESHYSASIDYFNKLEGSLNYAAANEVSKQLKLIWGDV